MKVKCSQCGTEHPVPDNTYQNKKVFFYCTKCNNKIVVDGRKAFLSGTVGSVTFKEDTALPIISDILGAIPRFFNLTTFILSLIFAVASVIIILLFSMSVVKNTEFFMTHIPVLAVLSLSVFGIIVYGYALLLYLISKIQYSIIENPLEESLNWKFILFDAPEDLLSLLVLSIGFTFGSALLFLPVYALKQYGILYSGVLFPVLFLAALLCIFSLSLHRYIPAIIAGKSLYVRQTLIQLFVFIKREIVNIPFHIVLVEIISFFVNSLILLVFSFAFFVTSSTLSLLLGTDITGQIKTVIISIPAAYQGTGVSGILSALPTETVTGFIFLLLFVFILSIILWSLILNVRQSLVTQACWIMHKNPSSSVPRKVIIISLVSIVAFTLILFTISISIKVLPLIK